MHKKSYIHSIIVKDHKEALAWIVGQLQRLGVPFQAVGGLAARAHGATRPLDDLDFYVPATRLSQVAAAVIPFVVRSPAHYRDDHWDLTFMKIEYMGCEIELAGADDARYFDRTKGLWCAAQIDFGASVDKVVCGVSLPVMPFEQVVSYKLRLARDVDRRDIEEMQAARSER